MTLPWPAPVESQDAVRMDRGDGPGVAVADGSPTVAVTSRRSLRRVDHDVTDVRRLPAGDRSSGRPVELPADEAGRLHGTVELVDVFVGRATIADGAPVVVWSIHWWAMSSTWVGNVPGWMRSWSS